MTVQRRRTDKRRHEWAGHGWRVLLACPAPWVDMDPDDEQVLFDLADRYPEKIFEGANLPWYYALARLGWASDIELREMMAKEVSYCTKIDRGTQRQAERLRKALAWAKANGVPTDDLPDWWDLCRENRHWPHEWAEGRP